MPILNYTTQVNTDRTVEEIRKKLVAAGAQAVLMEYGDHELIAAISFRIKTPDGELSFRMPANPDGVLRAMHKSRKVPGRLLTTAQATRVSWRIIKDWVEAQLAMVESGNAEITQVFLSYWQSPQTGRTLYEAMKDDGFKLLTQGGSQA